MASQSLHPKTKSIKDRSRKLYKDGLLTDITFNLVNEQGTMVSFKAHKLILGMTSDVFKAMFFGPLAEKRTEIAIEDVTSKAFNNILRYTYLDELKLKVVSEAIDTALAAQKYMFDHLLDLCTEYLLKNLSTNNACICYEASKLFSDKKLEIEVFKKISKNPDIFFESSKFVTLSEESILALTEKSKLKIKPLILFKALYRWSKDQSKIEGNSKSLREHLEPFLPRIEFLRFSAKEFLSTVIPTGVLSNEEAAAIGRNLEENGVLRSPLPSWCNKCYYIGNRKQEQIIFNVENYNWIPWLESTEYVLKFTVTEEVNLLGFNINYDCFKGLKAEFTTSVELSGVCKATQTDKFIYKHPNLLTMDLNSAVKISPMDEFCKITLVCSSGPFGELKSYNGFFQSEQPYPELFKLDIDNPTVSRPLIRLLRFSKFQRKFIKEEEKNN